MYTFNLLELMVEIVLYLLLITAPGKVAGDSTSSQTLQELSEEFSSSKGMCFPSAFCNKLPVISGTNPSTLTLPRKILKGHFIFRAHYGEAEVFAETALRPTSHSA